jgi:spermidine synthase
VVDNPKVHVRIDDARHFLITTDQKFDAITSDPFDPWVKGAATLYSKEFFLAAKDHLNDGGVVTVFVQLYEAGTEAVKSEIATFMQAFPNAIVFANTYQGQGYDVVLVGQKTDGPIDVDRIQAKLSDPKYSLMAQSLSEIGMNSAIDLLGTFSGRGSMLRSWLADAQVNTDRNLRLQYLAGLGVNAYEQVNIQRELEAGKAYPEDLFKGSPETLGMLKGAIMGGR